MTMTTEQHQRIIVTPSVLTQRTAENSNPVSFCLIVILLWSKSSYFKFHAKTFSKILSIYIFGYNKKFCHRGSYGSYRYWRVWAVSRLIMNRQLFCCLSFSCPKPGSEQLKDNNTRMSLSFSSLPLSASLRICAVGAPYYTLIVSSFKSVIAICYHILRFPKL